MSVLRIERGFSAGAPAILTVKHLSSAMIIFFNCSGSSYLVLPVFLFCFHGEATLEASRVNTISSLNCDLLPLSSTKERKQHPIAYLEQEFSRNYLRALPVATRLCQWKKNSFSIPWIRGYRKEVPTTRIWDLTRNGCFKS